MRMLEHIAQQGQQIDFQAHTNKLRDIKIGRIAHELARLKAWRFGARTVRISAEHRELFEETLDADQASLEAQLEALQAQSGAQGQAEVVEPRRQPRRCPNTCSAWSTVTNPKASPVVAASRWCAWARTLGKVRIIQSQACYRLEIVQMKQLAFQSGFSAPSFKWH